MQAGKWNWKTQEYEPYTLPPLATTYSADMEKVVQCACCSNQLVYGAGYTSQEIHNDYGFGYTVCPKCHMEELKRMKEGLAHEDPGD